MAIRDGVEGPVSSSEEPVKLRCGSVVVGSSYGAQVSRAVTDLLRQEPGASPRLARAHRSACLAEGRFGYRFIARVVHPEGGAAEFLRVKLREGDGAGSAGLGHTRY